MVPFSGGDEVSYGYDSGSKAQEELCVAHNSVSALDDELVEEVVDQRRRPHVYHTHRVVYLA